MISLEAKNVPYHHHRHNLKNRFEILRTLGEGTYGKVKLAKDKNTGEKVAIKYIRKRKIHHEEDMIRIQREIKIMSSLQHPHIVNITEVFENKEKIILVMEFAAGGELYDYISDKKVLGETDARKFYRQIVSAVHHCHKAGIVHRDLKLENIVLDENNNAKIADFGLSNEFNDKDMLKTYCGSPLYASPEIVNGLPYNGPEVDCWSLGVLLYTLVYGAMPFDGSDFKKLKKQITEGDFYEPANPSDASSLIRQLLAVDPAKRATIEDICDHWWINVGYTYSAIEQGLISDRSYNMTTRCRHVDGSFAYSSDSDNDDESTVDGSSAANGRRASDEKPTRRKPPSLERKKPTESKPIRGILKNNFERRQKYRSGDSGCVILDAEQVNQRGGATAEDDEQSSPARNGGDFFDLRDIDAALDGFDSMSPPSGIPAERMADGHVASTSPPSYISGVKLRGILKKKSKFSGDDPTKRYSYGSVGSNSSGDILDFSYDSMDGERMFLSMCAESPASAARRVENGAGDEDIDLDEASDVYLQAKLIRDRAVDTK